MKYTFTLLKENEGDSREKIVLESRSSESPRHIALKILAYLLFRERTGELPLRIEPGDLGQRHRPDLLASEPLTDKPRLWIDCGQIEPKRLGRIAATNNGASIVVVKQTGREAELYAEAAKKEIPVLGQGSASFVGYIGFGEGFTARLIPLLRGANTFCLQVIQPDTIRLEVNTELLETPLHFFAADASVLSSEDFWNAATLV
jgi:hypothetical protein